MLDVNQADGEQEGVLPGSNVVNQLRTRRKWVLIGAALGLVILLAPTLTPPLRSAGFQALGPILAIALIVFSLFGDLPAWVAWTQRLGAWVFPGLALGTLVLLIPLLLPTRTVESSFFAFSPTVWAAYISIVLVSISFEKSTLPSRIYHVCRSQSRSPATLIPIYVVIAGLLGNILDGVSIIAISVVIFLSLLPSRWALRASFALLFGGLISNLITVAAEPTNIKFQDVLHSLLDRVSPSYWFTNWPISVLGILLPAAWLAIEMRWGKDGKVGWRQEDITSQLGFDERIPRKDRELLLSMLAVGFLGAGIIAHSILQAVAASSATPGEIVPLWLFLLPGGIVAVIHLLTIRRIPAALQHMKHEWPVWGKLMIIFSLLWFVMNALTEPTNVLAVFFTWPESARYGIMVLLSLASSITDNVALAAMQGSLLLNHPLSIWEIRLLFILLTWAGGFTPFGCLQSLALNSRLTLSTAAWFKQTLLWSGLAIVGGLVGLALIDVLYPTTIFVPR